PARARSEAKRTRVRPSFAKVGNGPADVCSTNRGFRGFWSNLDLRSACSGYARARRPTGQNSGGFSALDTVFSPDFPEVRRNRASSIRVAISQQPVLWVPFPTHLCQRRFPRPPAALARPG